MTTVATLLPRRLEERDGWRYTAFVANTSAGALQWLEARHPAHTRVEDRVRCVKDTGLSQRIAGEMPVRFLFGRALSTALLTTTGRRDIGTACQGPRRPGTSGRSDARDASSLPY